jgi:hypothetical protein
MTRGRKQVRREELEARHAVICAKGDFTEADIDELCRLEEELAQLDGPKLSRLAEEALREARERGYLGTDSSATWIEEQNIVNRAIARKKRAGQPGDPDRDVKMAREFQKEWLAAEGKYSRSRLSEIIGKRHGLKRRGAINAINNGLRLLEAPPLLVMPPPRRP